MGGDTSVSGADDRWKNSCIFDGNYIDVYLNGVKLKHDTDYNTNTANTVNGLSATAWIMMRLQLLSMMRSV